MTHEVDGQIPTFRKNVLSVCNTKLKALRTSEVTETVSLILGQEILLSKRTSKNI